MTQIAGPARPEQKTLMVEGVIAHEQVDPHGDQFNLDGLDCAEFLAGGHVTNHCHISPKLSEIVGSPEDIRREDGEMVMKAKVWDPEMVEILDRPDTMMGFALAGVIQDKEPLDGGRTLIKRCKLSAVALLPAHKLSDPRCVVKVLKP